MKSKLIIEKFLYRVKEKVRGAVFHLYDSDVHKIDVTRRPKGEIRMKIYDHNSLLIQARMSNDSAKELGFYLKALSEENTKTKQPYVFCPECGSEARTAKVGHENWGNAGTMVSCFEHDTFIPDKEADEIEDEE
jgi:hypothetical protein